jgi:hypothetical protein
LASCGGDEKGSTALSRARYSRRITKADLSEPKSEWGPDGEGDDEELAAAAGGDRGTEERDKRPSTAATSFLTTGGAERQPKQSKGPPAAVAAAGEMERAAAAAARMLATRVRTFADLSFFLAKKFLFSRMWRKDGREESRSCPKNGNQSTGKEL